MGGKIIFGYTMKILKLTSTVLKRHAKRGEEKKFINDAVGAQSVLRIRHWMMLIGVLPMIDHAGRKDSEF